ncbi:MAG: AMP-binding protein [Gammaproteobacteria bacterium]|jgi:crotonobetaine/carnitine-CoA ligase|nr:AMP-binding protein [Gammaproteobacteria bacterium]MBP6050876.1 AMP-binding protein [Pseudomonadales bacterium]MBK6584337.1 AMP-binding protein [Gammaproteobacteria bacterium]MBK7520798.1 AMP-binding protein [Gammaproteobacteria bacterium]MBK7727958.1 AMP-binding protein [Gammaproteobacteria bacterium]
MRERNEFILADLISLRAEQKPDLDVLTFEHYSLDDGASADEVRTYADLFTNANRLAAWLLARGMRRGERFVIMLRNHPEFVEAMIAASMTGTVFVPVDPRTRADKIAFMVNNSGSRGVVCAGYNFAEVEQARRSCPALEWSLLLEPEAGQAEAAAWHIDPLHEVLAAAVPTVQMAAVTLSDPIQIIYTSGTTGDPKGIVGNNQRFGGTGMMGFVFGYQPDERPYTGLSFTHNNAQATALCPSLYGGHRAVFSRKFTKSKLWDICRRYGCTSFSLLGGMATAVYSEPPRADDAANPVRLVISGGMPAAIWEAFERRFDVRIFEIYGASDGGGMAFNAPGQGPVGSFGKPLPGYAMKILDDAGNECPPGVVGEICCGPAEGSDVSVAVEYFANPEASQRKLRDGWNRSGDMGHADAAGWLFFDYRKGGGIRHNGDFINTSYVEKVVAECPLVDDVYVYGVSALSGAPGEKDVVAAVVARTGQEFDAAAVFAHCRAGLEPNFVPGYLQLVDEIPKTASEKPQERFLLEQFRREAANVFASR